MTLFGMCVGGNYEPGALWREEWLNRPLELVNAFGGHAAGWTDYRGSICDWATLFPATRRLTLAVPLFPAEGHACMAGAASGDYLLKWHQVASCTKQRGHGDSIIRFGWEFQGDWYPWGYNYPDMDKSKFAERYVAIWREMVSVFRAVSGSDYKFDWCPNWSEAFTMSVGLVEACYPGDEYVDYIGLDFYDQNPWGAAASAVDTRFNMMKTAAIGLDWQKQFASVHGKPMSYPEWGAGQFGDTPAFISCMAAWIAENNVGYHCYWDRPPSDGYPSGLHVVTAQSYPGKPLQKEEFYRLFRVVTVVSANPNIRHIDMGGAGCSIGSVFWISPGVATSLGLNVSSTPIANKIVTWTTSIQASAFIPPVDPEYALMLNTQTNAQDTNMVITQTVDNGTYFVKLHTREAGVTANRAYNIKVQGTTVAGNVGALATNACTVYGPYTASVTDGILRVELVKQTGSPSICGLEILVSV